MKPQSLSHTWTMIGKPHFVETFFNIMPNLPYNVDWLTTIQHTKLNTCYNKPI